MPDWLRILSQALIPALATLLTMRWLARARDAAGPAMAGGRLQHPVGWLVIGVIGTLFFVGVIVAATLWPDEGVHVGFYAFMGCFVLLGLYLIADYRFARHSVSDAGMDFGRPTGRRLRFGWDEVRKVGFSTSCNWFRIELESGQAVRVPAMMAGLPVFAATLLEHVPATRIDRDSLKMLREAAQGKLPPV